MVEDESDAAAGAGEERAVFLALEALLEAFELPFLEVCEEGGDAFGVERPVVYVPAFFLVFFAGEADEVVIVQPIEHVARDVDLFFDLGGECEFADVGPVAQGLDEKEDVLAGDFHDDLFDRLGRHRHGSFLSDAEL